MTQTETAVDFLTHYLGLDKDSLVYERAKELENQQIENKAIHFAEWLTKKHTTTLIALYEQFEQTI